MKITTNKNKADTQIKGEFQKGNSGEFKQITFKNDVITIGLGKKEKLTSEKLRRVIGHVVKFVRDRRYSKANIDLDSFGKQDNIARIVAETSIIATYTLTKYKTDKKAQVEYLKEISITSNKNISKEVKEGIILGETTNYVKNLVNMPSQDLNPTTFAQEAKTLSKKYGFKVKILGKKELEKKGMNAILAVAKGSVQEPKLIIIETNPKLKNRIALVGKGVTFDSGGLDIKPWPHMKDMRCDMGGGAAVLGAVRIVGEMKLPVNLLAVIGAVENMPGPAAYKAGDIIKSYSGKTIEVWNTDAEGRIVLSDAVSYAEEQKPKALIDIATLTGASISTLGFAAAPYVTNDNTLRSKLNLASNDSGEIVWELPLLDDYREAVKGKVADVKNLGSPDRAAGVTTGATFIEAHIKNVSWAHIDIGAMAWFPADTDYAQEGATGFGTRLFASLLKNWK